MERRAFLIGGAVAAAGMVAEPALSQSPPAAGQPLAPSDIEAAVARLRKQFLAEFDPAYVENVIVPHFLVKHLCRGAAMAPYDQCRVHQGECAPL